MRCWAIAPMVLVARAIARLPQRVLLALGGALTVVAWPLLASRRRVARINLALCFPALDARAQRRLLRDNLVATVTGALELLRAWYAPPAALHGLGDIRGLDTLRAALDGGRGVMLLTGHFTHTELAVRLIVDALQRPVRGVVRRNNNPCLEATFEHARAAHFGATLEKKDVRGLLRVLQSAQAVAYSADQNFNFQHAFVPFFGVPAATLTTVPALVQRAGAVVLPLWFHRDATGVYRIEIGQAWRGWIEMPPEQAAAFYMRELEARVRVHPEQYLWVHRRFKTRPMGEDTFY